MQSVISPESLTGGKYYLEGYDIIGKTGTAQIYENGAYLTGSNDYIVSIALMYPKKDPEIIIYAAIKKPNRNANSVLTEPIKELVKNISKYKGMFSENETSNKELYKLESFINKNVSDVSKYLEDKSLSKLAKEPFAMSGEQLYNKIHKLNKCIKACLLDQTIMSGLGNIYVDEVLFDSSILPTRSATSLSEEECNSIVNSSVNILNKAIELKGSTIATYHFNNNETGGFQNEHKVYGKKDHKCCKCGDIIKKMVVAGRGTYYCQNCQK
jgi:formamidopyrimidine-DNA glycosylase